MKRVFVALVAVLALALVGCSQVDDAASVGDTQISLDQLQTQVDSILAERAKVDTSQMQLQEGEELTRSQLSFLISNVIIEAIADDAGIEISKSDLDAYKIEIYQNIGGEEMLPSVLVNAAIAPEGLDAALRRDLILQKLTTAATEAGSDDAAVNSLIQKLFNDKANELKISINPRYGVWDAETLSIVDKEPAGGAVTDK